MSIVIGVLKIWLLVVVLDYYDSGKDKKRKIKKSKIREKCYLLYQELLVFRLVYHLFYNFFVFMYFKRKNLTKKF